MKKFKKKMYVMCTMALICAGAACFSSCSTDFWTIDDIATTSSTFYILGYLDGVGQGVKESDMEFKTDALINEWWNGLSFVQWWNEKFGSEETPETEESENTGTEDTTQDETVTE